MMIFFQFNCASPFNPTADLRFEEIELHFTKRGGWINTSKLDIFSSGLATAYTIAHASPTILDSASLYLNTNEQNEIMNLITSFSIYKKHYEPAEYVTDGNFHVIVLSYHSRIDTVTVYNAFYGAPIPRKLGTLIKTLEEIHKNILDGKSLVLINQSE
ncbi:MAG: hypothetical protein ACE5IR_17735 [bacterium]